MPSFADEENGPREAETCAHCSQAWALSAVLSLAHLPAFQHCFLRRFKKELASWEGGVEALSLAEGQHCSMLGDHHSAPASFTLPLALQAELGGSVFSRGLWLLCQGWNAWGLRGSAVWCSPSPGTSPVLPRSVVSWAAWNLRIRRQRA